MKKALIERVKRCARVSNGVRRQFLLQEMFENILHCHFL
jgi:hypothetical protein